MKRILTPLLIWIFVMVFLFITSVVSLLNEFTRNIFSDQLVSASLEFNERLPLLEQNLQNNTYPSCYSNWISGLIASRLGKNEKAHLDWAYFLQCSPNAINLVQAVAPENEALADLAVNLYPDDINALYWLVNLQIKNKDYLGSEALYQHIVQLRPGYAMAWCLLGSIQEKQNRLQTALSAFITCCIEGDPGFNGCNGAGRVMEKLGNPQQAIEYYRLSKWPIALQRADQLEQQLQQP